MVGYMTGKELMRTLHHRMVEKEQKVDCIMKQVQMAGYMKMMVQMVDYMMRKEQMAGCMTVKGLMRIHHHKRVEGMQMADYMRRKELMVDCMTEKGLMRNLHHKMAGMVDCKIEMELTQLP